jgi:hypothetical protein
MGLLLSGFGFAKAQVKKVGDKDNREDGMIHSTCDGVDDDEQTTGVVLSSGAREGRGKKFGGGEARREVWVVF